MYKNIVIKLSGEAIGGESQNGYDDNVIGNIIDGIIDLINEGVKVSLVIGGGNFWRGRSSDSKMDRTKADNIGMLATIMNGIYMADALKQRGIYAEVFTPFKVGTLTSEFSKNDAMNVMINKGVCIFSGGIGHPFFSTDTITALRAAELECDAILYAKSVDGIYDKDPNKYPDAIKYKKITYADVIKKDLQAIDISAMNLCNSQKIESVVFQLDGESSLVQAAKNNDEIYEIGTKVIFE